MLAAVAAWFRSRRDLNTQKSRLGCEREPAGWIWELYIGMARVLARDLEETGIGSLTLESCSVMLDWRRRRCFVGSTRQRKGVRDPAVSG